MRLLTWNLNGRRRIDGQVFVIAARNPDILALQEVTLTSVLLFRTALADVGFPYVTDSFVFSTPWQPVGPRRYGLLIASRYPLSPKASSPIVPWRERLLSTQVATPQGPITIHTTHISPGSSNGWMKVEMLEAVATVVGAPCNTPQILCGDFNVPQAELPDGRIVTWAEYMLRTSLRGSELAGLAQTPAGGMLPSEQLSGRVASSLLQQLPPKPLAPRAAPPVPLCLLWHWRSLPSSKTRLHSVAVSRPACVDLTVNLPHLPDVRQQATQIFPEPDL